MGIIKLFGVIIPLILVVGCINKSNSIIKMDDGSKIKDMLNKNKTLCEEYGGWWESCSPTCHDNGLCLDVCSPPRCVLPTPRKSLT